MARVQDTPHFLSHRIDVWRQRCCVRHPRARACVPLSACLQRVCLDAPQQQLRVWPSAAPLWPAQAARFLPPAEADLLTCAPVASARSEWMWSPAALHRLKLAALSRCVVPERERRCTGARNGAASPRWSNASSRGRAHVHGEPSCRSSAHYGEETPSLLA